MTRSSTRWRRATASLALLVAAGLLISGPAPTGSSPAVALPTVAEQPQPPIRAAFMYPWFPTAWSRGSQVPFSHFEPVGGQYDSADPAVIDRQISQASVAGLEAFITPWWGPDHFSASATRAVIDQIPDSSNPAFRVAVHYQREGLSDPEATAIRDDLETLEELFAEPGYLRVDNKPVVFVWADADDGAAMASRWSDAVELYGGDVYVVLKIFSGYEAVADQPDSWHQFGAANNYSEKLPYSVTVSPGFWHGDDTSPLLEHDPDRFRRDVQSMAASGAQWQLITTWNDWGQGSMLEPSTEFGTTYLDILAEELGADTGDGATTLTPVADSFVDASADTTNYGSFPQMRVDGSPDRYGYVRFDVSGLDGAVTSATLRVYTLTTQWTGFAVQGVADNAWDEMSITYANAPAVGPVLGASGATTARTYTDIDVTGYVVGDGSFSFALTPLHNTNMPLATRETANPPELLITQDGSLPPLPPPQPPPPPPTTSPPPGGGVVFAAGGDFGATSATDATFGSMGESGAEFLLALGDLSYDDATAEEWCGYVKGFLGDVFPVELVVGNHEDDDRVDGFIGDFAACLPDRMGSSGVYAAEYFFDVDGLARFIMIGAGNDVDGVKYDYEVGNSHYQWLEDTIDGARSEGIPWVIVGMHKPCVTAGNKSCEVGAEVYDLLLDKRVDLILHGHDHDYQRSKQLVCVTPEVYRSECVVDSGADGVYSRGAGSVFIINGNTGGGGLTDIDTGDSEIGYLAEWHGANSADPGRGYTLFTLTSDELQVQFVGTTTSYTDTFTIN